MSLIRLFFLKDLGEIFLKVLFLTFFQEAQGTKIAFETTIMK